MRSACLVIFYLVCPRRRGRRSYGPQKSATVLSHLESDLERIIKGEHAITAIAEQTRCFFEHERILPRCHLKHLSLLATAVEAHGPSFENRLPQHTKTAHVKCETCTGWNIRFLNINAVSPLRNSDFYCLSLQFYWLACVVSVIAYLPPYSIYNINILGLAEPVEWNIFDVGIHNSS